MRMLIWIVFGFLAATWTGMSWLLGTAVEWASGLLGSGTAVDWASVAVSWSLPNWLLPWVDLSWLPALQLTVLRAMEALQGAWPGVGTAVGWLVPLVWIGWGLGMLVLLVLAVLAHVLTGKSGASGDRGPGAQPRPA